MNFRMKQNAGSQLREAHGYALAAQRTAFLALPIAENTRTNTSVNGIVNVHVNSNGYGKL